MNRSRFAVTVCGIVLFPSRGSFAQESLEIVSQLIDIRDRAESDLKQVHLLAKYGGIRLAPPVDVAEIDALYDTMATAVNAYVTAFAATVERRAPLDDPTLNAQSEAAIAATRAFDDALQKLKDRSGSTGSTRGGSDKTASELLSQAVLPHSSVWSATKKAVDNASDDGRSRAAKIILTARWPDSAAVLLSTPLPAR